MGKKVGRVRQSAGPQATFWRGKTEVSWWTGPPLPEWLHSSVRGQVYYETHGCKLPQMGGYREDLQEPWGLCRGFWCRHRFCRPGCNQLHWPILWATHLPKCVLQQLPCLAVGTLGGDWCLPWSPTSVQLLAPSMKRCLSLVSRRMEKREAAESCYCSHRPATQSQFPFIFSRLSLPLG